MIKREVIKWAVIGIAVYVWSLLCIYGTYNNTVQNAQIVTVSDGYVVTYANTGEMHYYKWR